MRTVFRFVFLESNKYFETRWIFVFCLILAISISVPVFSETNTSRSCLSRLTTCENRVLSHIQCTKQFGYASRRCRGQWSERVNPMCSDVRLYPSCQRFLRNGSDVCNKVGSLVFGVALHANQCGRKIGRTHPACREIARVSRHELGRIARSCMPNKR